MESFNLKILLCISVIMFAAAMPASGASPANDYCADAQHVGEITNLPFDTREATFDGIGACFRSPNIWYVYTPTGSGNATISLCGSDFDTVLAVYEGSGCPPSDSRLLGCNDDACDRQSEISLPVVAGQQYLIEIGSYSTGYSTEPGEGVLTITNTGGGGPQPPVNDNCQNALQVGEVTNLAFDTTYASYDGPGGCVRKTNIWYVYTPTSTGNATISLCGSQFDTMLAVYSGNACPATNARLLGCNDNSCGEQSELTIPVVVGQKYLVEIGAYGNDKGHGVLTITNAGGGAPANDNCQNAQQVSEVTNLPFNTTQATFDGPGVCQTGSNIWYVYTPTSTGDATISLCGSQFDTILAIYSGNACPATGARLLGCNDDSCNYQSEITLPVIAGQKYLVEVGAYGSDKGEGVLTITNSGGGTAPANDDCRNARQIGDVTNLLFDTTNATFDGVGACMNGPNIWYVYTASCTGDVTVSLCGSQFDTMLAVYSRSTCSAFNSRLLGCNDDSCGYQSEVTFAAIAGRKYTIEVGGYDSDTGQGVLTVSCGGGGVPNPSDLGDAPDSTNNIGSIMTAYPMGGALGVRANYPTVYDDGTNYRPRGPIHRNEQKVAYLGECITGEDEADSGFDEDGINNINPSSNTPNEDRCDDGVIFPVSMPQCRWTTFNYKVRIVQPNSDFWINVWCDWNRDGDWDDTINNNVCASIPEWAVQNKYIYGLSTGVHELTTPAFMSWHPKSGTKQIWMRITLSDQPWTGGSGTGLVGNGGSGPSDGYEYGETEDLYFIPDTTASVCEDFNGDGVINQDDLSTFVDDWLANCQ